jgi:hypothetical protein
LCWLFAPFFFPLGFFILGASNAWITTDEEAMVTMEHMHTLLHEHAVRSFETHEAVITALDTARIRTQPRRHSCAARGSQRLCRRFASFLSSRRWPRPGSTASPVVLSSQSISVDTKSLSDPAAIKALRDQNRRIAVSKASDADEQGASQFFLEKRIRSGFKARA